MKLKEDSTNGNALQTVVRCKDERFPRYHEDASGHKTLHVNKPVPAYTLDHSREETFRGKHYPK